MPYCASKRIVIVGGGVSGLAIAARIAQAGLPVTVLERSRLGGEASTRNQGWLVSGAWYAPENPGLAALCYESLQQTLDFCPECLEPGRGAMVYLIANAETSTSVWTSAWEGAGIPYCKLPTETLFERFPELAIGSVREAYQLPDRAIRADRLLRRLASSATRAGAEILEGVAVLQLLRRNERVIGVETAAGETIPARLVILAGNAKGAFLYPGYGTQAVGSQPQEALMAVKTHLVAVRPEVSPWPLCVLDHGGFHHIPHVTTSVFGSNRWKPVRNAEDVHGETSEFQRIWESVRRFFPDVRLHHRVVAEWAGTTVQAMHIDQVEAGRAPRPTIVDHRHDSDPVDNLLSVFPGRASLWPYLAERATRIVLDRLEMVPLSIAEPPWGEVSPPADRR